ncbi:MAG: lipoate protein ligase C-terminal domain-containing protein, partial [Oscillospiraceae bacterium]
RKFSGNAFYNNGTNSYHHGTLLINADMTMLSKYLTVSKQKLSSKGVNSVQSRVANLSEFNTEITVCSMKEKLIEAFGEVYGITPQKLTEDEFDKAVLAESREKFASWEWLFGKRLEFTATMNEKFVWGEIEIQLQVDKGKVKKALIYTDAMEHSGFELIEDALKDCIFSTVDMAQAVCKLAKNNGELKQTILNDIQGLILRQNF